MLLDNKYLTLPAAEPNAVQPPSWLGRFADLATRAFHSADQLPPVGCHFHQHEYEDGTIPQWEVTLFATSTEVFGGAFDGLSATVPFMLDLRSLMEIFDGIESLYWQSQTMADDDAVGPHVGVEGFFEGHSVWLRVAAEVPSQIESDCASEFCATEEQDRW